MKKPAPMDVLDRQLLASLLICPRAQWAQLAPILGTSPSTLSRRWDALASAGVVWSTAMIIGPGQRRFVQAAFVEVRCIPGRREEAIASLLPIPEIVNIATCAGEHDLMLNLATETVYEADTLVDRCIATAPGVAQTRTNYSNGVVVEGSRFRLDGLDPVQRAAVKGLRPTPRPGASEAPTPTQRHIAEALVADARASASSVARLTGLSAAHTQRQIALMDSSPWFVPRTDFSLPDLGISAVYFWVRCPVSRMDTFLRKAAQSRGLRLLVPIVARSNILLSVWLPGLEAISDFERELVRAMPEVEVVDRWLQTSNRKRVGLAVGRDGRRVPGRDDTANPVGLGW